MLKDHLGNVRAVLTDEEKADMYPSAFMEDVEEPTDPENYLPYYGAVDYASYPACRYPIGDISGYPGSDPLSGSKNEYVVRLVGHDPGAGGGGSTAGNAATAQMGYAVRPGFNFRAGSRGWGAFIGFNEGEGSESDAVLIGTQWVGLMNMNGVNTSPTRSIFDRTVSGLNTANDALGLAMDVTEHGTIGLQMAVNKSMGNPAMKNLVSDFRGLKAFANASDAVDIFLDARDGNMGRASVKGAWWLAKRVIQCTSPVGFAIVAGIDLVIGLNDIFNWVEF